MGLKYNDRVLNIGSPAFAVHKNYVDQKLGGKIVVYRVKTFENKQGTIVPILTEVGNSRRELDSRMHYLYFDIDSALKAITTKK